MKDIDRLELTISHKNEIVSQTLIELDQYLDRIGRELFNKNYSHIKTRSQLIKKDSGLYNKLKSTGKLDEVFPDTKKRSKPRKLDEASSGRTRA